MDQLVANRIRRVTLTGGYVDCCRRHGDRMCEGWASGRKSSALSMNGAERDPVKQAFWKMGEVAFCMEFGLDPMTKLDWSDRSDDGHDVEFRSRLVDVKTIEAHKKLMLWPASKANLKFYGDKNFHWFVLAQGDGPSFVISKCIPKWGFYSQMKVAMAGNPKLQEGTWYMETKDLGDIERFCEIVGHTA